MDEIKDYIEKARAAGQTDEQIIAALKNAGWDDTTVSNAFSQNSVVSPTQATEQDANADAMQKHMQNVTGAADDHATTAHTNRKWMVKVGVIVLAIVILGGGGYFAYAKYFATPSLEKLWADVVAVNQNLESAHFEQSFNYSDSYSLPEEISDEELAQEGLDRTQTLSMNGNFMGDFVKTGENFNQDIKYSFNFDEGSSFLTSLLDGLEEDIPGLSMETRVVDSVYFMRMPGYIDDWVIIEKDWLNLFNAASTDYLSTNSIKQMLATTETTELVGKEEKSGSNTWHIFGKLKSAELIESMLGPLNQFSTDSVDQETADQIESLFNRIEGDVDIWVDTDNKHIIEAVTTIRYPSFLTAVTGVAQISARQKSRDAERLADVRQLMTVAELYYNDNAQYPPATGGLPDAAAVADYISEIPIAPQPADGNCTIEENYYTYSPSLDGADYTIKFCLGGITGGLQAGVQQASEGGLTTIEPREDTLPETEEFSWADLPLTASITSTAKFSRHNQPITITAPEGAKSYEEYLNESVEQGQMELDAMEETQ